MRTGGVLRGGRLWRSARPTADSLPTARETPARSLDSKPDTDTEHPVSPSPPHSARIGRGPCPPDSFGYFPVRRQESDTFPIHSQKVERKAPSPPLRMTHQTLHTSVTTLCKKEKSHRKKFLWENHFSYRNLMGIQRSSSMRWASRSIRSVVRRRMAAHSPAVRRV